VQHKLLQTAPLPPSSSNSSNGELGVGRASLGRGGYCFEHNTLMMDALRAIGFGVQPLLARVRWNKAADAQTTFTHVVLRVTWPLQSDDDASQAAAAAPSSSSSPAYLVDVAFGGIGPLSPLVLGQVLLLPLLLPPLLLSKIQHCAPVQPPSAFQSIPYFKP